MGRAHEVRAASMAKTAAMKSAKYARWGKEIFQAAKAGVPDPEMNQGLKRIIERAKKDQCPADVIKRAIEKAKGGSMESYYPIRYEGFGPNNSLLMIECLTDNHNRTQTDVKVAFQKTGGKIASSGSVTYQFKHLAVFVFKGLSEEDAVMALLDADCDVQNTYTEIDEETGEEKQIENAFDIKYEPEWITDGDLENPVTVFEDDKQSLLVGPFSIDYIEARAKFGGRPEVEFAGITAMELYTDASEEPLIYGEQWELVYLDGERTEDDLILVENAMEKSINEIGYLLTTKSI